jgi:hypothetical protein
MTRAVEQIEHEIAGLERSIAAIAQDLHTTYSHYLTDLSQAVKRQLVLAAYYICTQGYPDQFLSLSLSQRQELQRALKQLATHAQTQLLSQLKSLDEFDPDIEDEFLEDDAEDESAEDELPEESQEEALDEEISLTDELSESLFFEADRSSTGNSSQSTLNLTDDSHEEPKVADLASDPDLVMDWQESLEKGISAVLHTFSYTANRLLQKTNVLPAKLPDPILEVAAKAGSEIASGTPNVLNLLIEAEGDREEEAKITHIMTIRLRLSEIEFADATLGAWRSKLRGLLARLNQLERDYQKKHQEKTIASAEAAWRSIWFDE